MRLGDDVASAGQQLHPRSLPLGKIWSVFTSEVGSIFTQGTTTTTDGAGATTSPVPVTMITTRVPIPVLTTTVDTTIVRTSYITVHTTAAVPIPPSHTTKCQSLDCENTLITKGGQHTSITKGSQHTSLPEVVTRKTSLQTTKTPGIKSYQTEQSMTAPSATSSPPVSQSHNASNKHAIIGGLSGAIAGLVLIGALIIFFLRKRRRRRRDEEAESMSEKGLRPILARKWSQLTSKRSTIGAAPVVSRGTTPDLDGGLIRVSMDNWPRPFAHGESFRESMGPGRLRVMNPDPSRPVTPLPRGSSESATGGFFKQPRTALAAFLGNRSRGNSSSGTPNRDLQIPTIAVDPASSSDHIAPQVPTPSFRSYPSVTSLPFVEQRPPEDPFLTPPDERDELSNPPTPRRPGITPLQSAAGAASRTLSHIGSALNPFRSKSNLAASMKSQQSRHSVSTFFSSSSAGNPFKLDRPSVYESSIAAREEEPPDVPRWTVYEGT
jgi:hypothetical protein